MSRQTRKIVYDFRGALAPPVVASRQGPWCSKITKTAGSPTVQSQSGGPLELTLDATAEVQNLCLYNGDVLPFLITDLIRIEFIAKLSASIAAAVSGFIGLGSARNDAVASIAQRAGFLFSGSNALTVDGVDGTNSQTGKATGYSLSTVYRRFAIDLSVGNLGQSPPSLSKGGQADVRFFMTNDLRALNQVCPATRFDLSAYSNGLQFIAQLQKTANAATGTLSLLEASFEFRLPA
jgi:hypothetical protein